MRLEARQWKAKAAWFDEIGYDPHPGQELLHRSQAQFRLLFAGARWGKSYGVAPDVELLASVPGTHTWIVGPTYDLGLKEFTFMWQHYLASGLLAKATSKSLNPNGPPHIEWEPGHWIRVKSAEVPDSLVGDPLDCLVLAEGSRIPGGRIWQECLLPRLSDRNGIMVGACTPCGLNWLTQAFKKAQSGEYKEDWETWLRPATENPHIPEKAWKLLQRELSPEAYREQVLGIPTVWEGLVYSNFSDRLNVMPWEWNKNYTTLCLIDFGLKPGVQWVQENSKNGVWVTFDEFCEDDVPLDELCKILLEKHDEYRVGYYFGDPHGTRREYDGTTAIQSLREWSNGRINVMYTNSPRLTKVTVGVEAMRARICNDLGERRWFIAEHLCDPKKKRGVYVDILRYRWRETAETVPRPDEPLKDGVCDHNMDAQRYGIINRFSGMDAMIRKDKGEYYSEDEKEDRLQKRQSRKKLRLRKLSATGY